MQALWLELIKQLNSSVFILIGIFIITCYVLYLLGQWKEKFFNHEKKIDSLSGLSDKVLVMQTKVDLIYQYLNPHGTVKAMSPLSITEIGKKIMERIDADKIFNKYVSKLKTDVEACSPETAYDIQIASMRVAKEKLITYINEDELNLMKQEAYNNGILLEDVLSIFGILLRNHILNEKSIPIAEVDNHSKK